MTLATDKPELYKRIKESVGYSNKFLTLFDDYVQMPDRSTGRYVRIRYQSGVTGVVIVPQRPDGTLLLIRAPRYAVEAWSLEFPRGTCDRAEETRHAAVRELFEETGLRADAFERLGTHWPDGAIMQVEAEIFLATVSSSAEFNSQGARHEGIQGGTWYPIDRIWRMVAEGSIRDGFTLGAMALLYARTGR